MNCLLNKKIRTFGLVALSIGLMPLVSGCSLDKKTTMNMSPGGKIQLEQSQYSDAVETDMLDEKAIWAISDYYRNHGEGPVHVAVTYDPQSRVNTARKASTRAADIAGQLRKAKVPVAAVDVLPVQGQGDVSRTLFEYAAIFAKEPEDCVAMGGLDGQPTDWNEDYAIGCTIKMQMARQIASPSDMMGRAGVDSGDGRRLSNIITNYRTGEPLPPLRGETVSGD